MKRKAALMLLIGTVALCLLGCGEDQQASNTGKENKTASKAPAGQESVQPAPQGQGETAGTAGTAGTTGTAGAAGTGMAATALQNTAYIQGAQKILSTMEEKLTAWQQQTGTQGQPNQEKMQTLVKQAQQQIADAKAALEKMKTAMGDQLKDAKVAADTAMQNAEQAFKNLQSYMSGTQVTQEQ